MEMFKVFDLYFLLRPDSPWRQGGRKARSKTAPSKGGLTARAAARQLGISHPTFWKRVKEDEAKGDTVNLYIAIFF